MKTGVRQCLIQDNKTDFKKLKKNCNMAENVNSERKVQFSVFK